MHNTEILVADLMTNHLMDQSTLKQYRQQTMDGFDFVFSVKNQISRDFPVLSELSFNFEGSGISIKIIDTDIAVEYQGPTKIAVVHTEPIKIGIILIKKPRSKFAVRSIKLCQYSKEFLEQQVHHKIEENQSGDYLVETLRKLQSYNITRFVNADLTCDYLIYCMFLSIIPASLIHSMVSLPHATVETQTDRQYLEELRKYLRSELDKVEQLLSKTECAAGVHDISIVSVIVTIHNMLRRDCSKLINH